MQLSRAIPWMPLFMKNELSRNMFLNPLLVQGVGFLARRRRTRMLPSLLVLLCVYTVPTRYRGVEVMESRRMRLFDPTIPMVLLVAANPTRAATPIPSPHRPQPVGIPPVPLRMQPPTVPLEQA